MQGRIAPEIQAVVVAFQGTHAERLRAELEGMAIGVSIVDNGPELDPAHHNDGSHRNFGFGTAANIGYRRAVQPKTKWIIVANDDALPTSGALEWIGTHLLTLPRNIGIVGFCYGQASDTTGDRRLFPSVRGVLWMARHGERMAIELHPTACHPVGAFFAVRRSAFEKLGGFDTDFFLYFEETDLFYRALRDGWEIEWAPAPAVVEHKGAASAGSAPVLTAFEYGRSAVIYARKRGWRFAFSWLPLWTLLMGALGLRALAQRNRPAAISHAATLAGVVSGTVVPSLEPLRWSRLRAVARPERRLLGFVPPSIGDHRAAVAR